MFDTSNKVTVQDLRNRFDQKGHPWNETLSTALQALQEAEKHKPPLYVLFFLGISAFLLTIFLIGFVLIALKGANTKGLIGVGLVLILIAFRLQKGTPDLRSLPRLFAYKLSFTSMFAGKILFVLGAGSFFNHVSSWHLLFFVTLITAVTYPFFHMFLDRFLSLCVLFFVLLLACLNRGEGYDTDLPNMLLLNGSFCLQLMSAAFFLTAKNLSDPWRPLARALVVSLIFNVLFVSHLQNIFFNQKALNLTFMTGLLTLSLLFLIGWIGGRKRRHHPPLLSAFLGSLVLGFLSTPGILLSLILMILGYEKPEKILILLGAFCLPIFLFLFYYSLDLTLLTKSGILIGSGLLLLAGRFYVLSLDREEAL